MTFRAQGQTLSANYLSSYLLNLTGLENTGYGQYLMGLREKIPALNAYGFLGTDGHQHEYGSDEITDAENDEIEDYRCLIYDELTQGGKETKIFTVFRRIRTENRRDLRFAANSPFFFRQTFRSLAFPEDF